MLQCLDGIKHLGASLSKCCDLGRQSTGFEDPEILARETVCMLYESFVNILVLQLERKKKDEPKTIFVWLQVCLSDCVICSLYLHLENCILKKGTNFLYFKICFVVFYVISVEFFKMLGQGFGIYRVEICAS